MATVTVYTAEKMQEIQDGSVVDGDVVSGHLILTKYDGSQIDAGLVEGPAGPTGPTGPAGVSSIPGEIKLWPGSVLPVQATYGKWDWCDGGVLSVATYPIAAGHISSAWKTFGGASDPGAGNFRKPDLRGLVPAGLDQMPGGVRANRMTRAIAITLAGKTGEETHVITLAESALHDHGGGNHDHVLKGGDRGSGAYSQVPIGLDYNYMEGTASAGTIQASGNIITPQGGNGAHENVQPTVFVPYIVRLDG